MNKHSYLDLGECEDTPPYLDITSPFYCNMSAYSSYYNDLNLSSDNQSLMIKIFENKIYLLMSTVLKKAKTTLYDIITPKKRGDSYTITLTPIELHYVVLKVEEKMDIKGVYWWSNASLFFQFEDKEGLACFSSKLCTRNIRNNDFVEYTITKKYPICFKYNRDLETLKSSKRFRKRDAVFKTIFSFAVRSKSQKILATVSFFLTNAPYRVIIEIKS